MIDLDGYEQAQVRVLACILMASQRISKRIMDGITAKDRDRFMVAVASLTSERALKMADDMVAAMLTAANDCAKPAASVSPTPD